jgi:ATP phosphoribosyltransferase regulatory subunit HisZ
VDYAALHADFLKQSAAKIQLRIENLHSVLPELKEAQRRALVSAVKQYH